MCFGQPCDVPIRTYAHVLGELFEQSLCAAPLRVAGNICFYLLHKDLAERTLVSILKIMLRDTVIISV